VTWRVPTVAECDPGHEPTEFMVLVAMAEKPSKSAGGILLPEATREREQWGAEHGRILAISPLAFSYSDLWRRPSDKVIENQEENEDEEGGAEDSPTTFAEVAATMGWKPKAEFKPKREGDKWLPARDFVAAFNERQRNTMRANRDLKSKLDRVALQVEKVSGRLSASDRDALKAKAREHMEAGEYDKAEELFDKAAAPAGDSEHPALTAFKERNDWFGVDDEATAYADALDKQFAKGGIADPDAHMRKVEAGVKKRFPELFEKDAGEREDREERGERPQRRAPLVARGGGGDRPRQDGKLTVADLTPRQRRAADAMGVTLKDYVENLNQMNGAA
jgi:co-chaperonin GroES (HSP10)